MKNTRKSLRFREEYRSEYSKGLAKLTATEIAPLIPLVTRGANVVFDIGANVGLWTKGWLDTFADITSAVYMFEPLPDNILRIEKRLSDGYYDEHFPCSRLIHVHQAAVGQEPGTAEINYVQNNTTISSIVHDQCTLMGKSVALDQRLQVPVVNVDLFCVDNGIAQIDVMKIDTEGYELQVLHGAEGMLEKRAVGLILFEFGLGQLSSRHVLRDFWDLLTGYGYEMHRFGLGRRGWALEPLPSYQGRLEELHTVNMFLARLP